MWSAEPPFLNMLNCPCVHSQGSTWESLGRPFILSSVEEAKRIVDEAYKYSRERTLAQVNSNTASHSDILRLLKQPSRDARSAVRSAEYTETTLRLIKEKTHHAYKSSINATDMLSPEDMDTIARLTGCKARILPPSCRTIIMLSQYHTATGICNNLKNPRLGASNMPFVRWLPAQYEDGISQPLGWDTKKQHNGFLLPLVREVSNRILRTANKDVENDIQYSHLVTMFGQWIDHDLTFTPSSPSIRSFSNGINCAQSCERTNPCFPMKVSLIPPQVKCLPTPRSAPSCGTGEGGYMFGAVNVRQQMNTLTAFLDVGQVYGSEDALSRNLRDLTNDGGLLRVNHRFFDNGRELLPFVNMTFNFCATRQKITGNKSLKEVPCSLAGDLRVDENTGLTSLHTLMLREHNRLARVLHQLNPHWESERLYQEARKIMVAYHQVITFRNYLKLIVGPKHMHKHLGKYPGYNKNVDPSISNVFATAAYRFAHLTVQPIIFRLDDNYNEHPSFRSVMLHNTFFAPWRIIFEGGVDPVMRGLIGRPAKLNSQKHMMHDELRERLFEFSNSIALDLASLNMQRGRDHALPGYNAWRKFCGLSQPKTLEELAVVMQNKTLAKELMKMYGTPDNIDVWLGGVAEPFVKGGRVGPLFACLIATQFQKIRQGDRLWWENNGVFSPAQRASLACVSMARIICDNTGITRVPKNPFLLNPKQLDLVRCKTIPTLNLKPWLERPAGNRNVPTENANSKGIEGGKPVEIPPPTMNDTQYSAFSMRLGNNPPKPGQVIIFGEATDEGQGHYSTETGMFTCMVSGMYQFHFHCILPRDAGSIHLMRNGELVVPSFLRKQEGFVTASGGAVLLLKKEDRVWLQGSHGAKVLSADSTFTGYLLFVM
uniref:Myeloperoxidase-like n=1 Tax=Scleropages formosus TaxID=113540 RepID=A0A8C9U6M2_SCLFO